MKKRVTTNRRFWAWKLQQWRKNRSNHVPTEVQGEGGQQLEGEGGVEIEQ